MGLIECQKVLDVIGDMKHSKLRNYIVPGLTSSLIGNNSDKGKVRLFESNRETWEFITPHSHRFDFACLVLQGMVKNTIFIRENHGDEWCLSTIDQVCGEDGLRSYKHVRSEKPSRWSNTTSSYMPGQEYSMKSNEVHSIKFSNQAVVLFFEGPPKSTCSIMLEPWENNRVVPTFRTESWMFEREDL